MNKTFYFMIFPIKVILLIVLFYLVEIESENTINN